MHDELSYLAVRPQTNSWSIDRQFVLSDGDLDVVEAGFQGKAEMWLNQTPLFTADVGGDLIAFASNQDGDWDIYTIGVDGDGLRQLTQNLPLPAPVPGAPSPVGGQRLKQACGPDRMLCARRGV